MATEVELKLALPVRSLRRAERLPWLRRLATAPPERSKMSSVYFDTKGLKLRRHGVTLRVRGVGSKRLQTIKADNGADGALGRFEREDEIASQRPKLKYAKATPLAPLVTAKLKKGMHPLFRTNVRRKVLNVRLNDSDIELAFDQGTVRAGARTEPLHELELELKHGSAEDLAALARRLSKDLPIAFVPQPKSDRGYALVAGTPDGHVGTAPVALDPCQPAGAAFQQIGLACLRHFAANQRAVMAGDAEGIHQMRVGLRRLRAAISLFRGMLRQADVEAVKKDLKWITAELGPARDLDVLTREALAPLRKANPDKPEIEALEQDTRRQRSAAFARARAAVASPRFRDVVLRTALWLLDGQWCRAQGRGADIRSKSAVAVAARILEHRAGKIIKKAKQLEKLDARRRHKLRIAAKKLRYGCEFFAGLFGHPKRQGRYRKALKDLQSGLGRLNDFRVHDEKARRITHRRGHGPQQAAEAYAMGLLIGGETQSSRRILSAAKKAGRKLAHARSYW